MNQPVPLEHGAIITFSPDDPAAATNFLITLANGFRWTPISVNFRLACDSNVTNRHADLMFNLDATEDLWLHSTVAQTASQTFDISWLAGWPVHGVGAVNRMTIGMPEFLILNGGGSLESSIRQMQAGDQISNISALFRRWPMQTV